MNQEPIKNEIPPVQKKKMNGCLMASIIVVIVAILTVGGCFILGGAAIVGSAKKESEKLQSLKSSPPSDLQPTGELANIFNLMSDHTNLQRENKEKEIKGKIVDWTLSVYEVRKSGKNYRIQTKAGPNVGTFVTIIPSDQSEITFIEQLKTGDLVRFKGLIDGVSMRSLDIQPAILINANAPSSEDISKAGNSGNSSEPRPQPANVPQQNKTQTSNTAESTPTPQYTIIGKPSKCGFVEINVTTIDYSQTISGSLGNSNASDGATFVIVNWTYKNISSQPMNALNKPVMYLVSNENARFKIDMGASAAYASSLDNNEKILSDLNPGIKSSTSSVFEVAKELYDPFTWKILVEHQNSQTWFTIREKEKIPSSIEKLISIGQAADFEGISTKIDSVTTKNSYGNHQVGYAEAVEGSTFVEINWSIENHSDDPIASDKIEIFLVPEDGRKYVAHRLATVLSFIDDGGLYQNSKTIDPNIKLKRRDVFEVPKLKFKPSAWGLIVRRGDKDNWFSLIQNTPTQAHAEAANGKAKPQSSGESVDSVANKPIDDARAELELEKIKLERERIELEREKIRMQTQSNSGPKTDEPKIAAEQIPAPTTPKPADPATTASSATVPAMPGERYPETRLQILGSADLMDLNLNDLRYAINEMYARRGASFKQAEIAKNFKSKEWYKPRPGVSFEDLEKEFSTIEADNLRFLGKERDRKAASADLYELIDSESNLREGPGTDYPIVRKSRKGEIGEAHSNKKGWMKLQFSDGSMAWAHEQNIKAAK
ncbi:MAG: DUF4352 domain-containing protein [bacterium]